MKTSDLHKTTSSKLNENLSKTFGKKINFETFDIAKLEDARNKLRTQVHQLRSNSKFNENLDNDAYHQAQWMLDAINAELAEREGSVAEGMDPEEFKQKVADSGDAGFEMIVQALKGEHGAKIQSEMSSMYQDIEQDGMTMDDVLEAIMDRIEADYMDDYEADQDDQDDFDFRQEYDDDRMDDMMDDVNESQITESEVEEASAIVTAKTMVDKVSRWIEELSGMENDTLISLGDSIRDEMGSQQAKQFLSSTAPAIEDALSHLKQTRDDMSTALRVLTGEESATDMLGDEPDDVDVPGVIDTDADEEEEADIDDFAVAEPAAGGADAAGREQRESVEKQNNLYRILAG